MEDSKVGVFPLEEEEEENMLRDYALGIRDRGRLTHPRILRSR